MSFQRVRYLSIFSFGFSVLLAVAGGIFAYLVSPLRDATFQPSSANAGSLLPWMRGMTENYWILGANILAILLSTNITLILWQKSARNQSRLFHFIVIICVWLGIFILLWIAFMGYLMSQWLID